ncbi:MAG: fibronectin type III domain-containing protein [Nitrospira sp.]|nr:fibronectin type III domain-containing protein [Nitrospira sp.]
MIGKKQGSTSPGLRLRWRVCVAGLLVSLLTLVVLPAAWAVQVSPSSLTFQAVQGGASPSSQVVNFYKKTSRQVSWASSDNAAWLSASAASGVMTTSAQVVVSVDTTGLAAGSYSGAVTVTISKGGSVSIPVTLTVSPATSSGTGTSTDTSTSRSSTSATLTWAANTESDLAGYNVYVGTASGAYGPPVNVGAVTSHTVGNLQLGTTYYFAVTAYDVNGNESVLSSEVSKSVY